MKNFENIYFYYSSFDNKLYIEALEFQLRVRVLIWNNDNLINVTELTLNKNIMWILPSVNLYDFKQIRVEIKDFNDNIIKDKFITIKKNVEKDNGNIKYMSGGLLGDFIYQLSIIKENYLSTNKKGDLYIINSTDVTSDGSYISTHEHWKFGVVKAYNDIKEIILSQNYISSFQLYEGEKFENYIHLSSWRNSDLLTRASIYEIFKKEYNVEWGSHKWLDLPTLDYYKDIILFSSTARKQNPFFDLNSLKKYNKKIFFTTTSVDEYNIFKKITPSCDFEIKFFDNLMDYWTAINSCYLFISYFSSFLAVANALHKNAIALLPDYNQFKDDVIHFSKNIPNLKWYENENKNNL